MKTYLPFVFLAALAFASCDKVEDAISHGGIDPDEETLTGLPTITFRAVSTTDDVVRINLLEGEGSAIISVYACANKELDYNQSLLIQTDESIIESYNSKNHSSYYILPAQFYSLRDNGLINIKASEKTSDIAEIVVYSKNPFGSTLPVGQYLLPLVLSGGQNIAKKSILLVITVKQALINRPDLYEGNDCKTIFYLNTSKYDPRLVTDFVIEKSNLSFERIWYKSIGNILNLRMTTIGFDRASNSVFLNPSSDMKYLCSHYETYFSPIKETGRKLCVCIECSNSEIGFCNMTEEQIEQLVYEIVQFVNMYGFDGVNLWDKNIYDKDSSQKFDTTSYPKLIKQLREKLPKDKLLTIVDYENSTSYFWNADATGNIWVGDYIDYAWSGYNNNQEPVQIIDPYDTITGGSTLHKRRPILGLDEAHYGKVNCPWYPAETDLEWITSNASDWIQQGGVTNGLFVFDDIRSILQDEYEGATFCFPANWLMLFDINSIQYDYSPNAVIYMFDTSLMVGTQSGYNKWIKNW